MNRDQKQILTELLVLRSQQGDPAAFREMYAIWHGALLHYAVLRVETADAAEEVMQEAWHHIARNLTRLNDPACFPRWAYQIVFRRSADWVRHETRRRRDHSALQRDAHALVPMDAPAPAAELEQRDRVQVALKELGESDREVLHLFYLSGFDIAAIAEVVGIPRGTVKSRLFHAREQLRNAMLSSDL